MSSKPENTFIAAVHRGFGNEPPYYEKMNNPLRSGTPDVYYSGVLGQLWIEYKFIPRIPKTKEILPDLTPLQARWLNDRFEEGRDMAVVVGTPDGGVIYRNKEWNIPLSGTDFAKRLVTKREVSQWIASNVGPSKCNSSKLLLPPLK